MAWTAKFLLPFRQSFSQSRNLFHGKIRPLKTWVHIFETKLQSRASKFEYMLSIQRKYVQDCCFSGNRHMRSIFGASVMFGAVYCWSHISHAMDGLDIFADDNHLESFDASEGEDDRHKLWLLMRKLWLPLFFVFTVLVNWDNPFAVITRILLFLLSTKPSPSSIYLFVEKLCHGYMRQKPHFYKYKALHASKVEVQDYKLLCLAIVEIGDEKIRLIGILGGWWSLPSSLGLYFLAPEQSSSSSL
ncbi:uncharacterized protein LOC105778167 [Gossypium raimondii]|uniref:Uncharacterized protein n=1 Tax=Gossypium raimondii TaxID=29730 RepID=A0A0D2UQK8_GOSRA|nr:uncharacterized protein LOC105778167 [Gossypium raimondii]KJB70903.1 hypothetical protein B456_011G095100 [Gossypium raimondii]KJB70904.1 hypothetical protein B456_011G095100 [Gossypium raimondii]